MENREWLALANAAAPTRPVAPSGGYPRDGLTPTIPGAYWFHQLGEEARAILVAADVAPDGTALTQLAQAIRRMAAANIVTVTAAMSPFQLTADHAGMVFINATAGPVVLTLPAANAVANLPLDYSFWKTDASANAATVNKSAIGGNVDAIDGVASFVLSGQYSNRSICGDAVSTWATLANSVVADASPAGKVSYFARSTAPAGYLKANGALVSRSVYAALFASVGTTFGVGDGATTFGLPDLRGEFPRGWDDSRGADSGRAFGSAQSANVGAHSHSIEGLLDISYSGGGIARYAPGSASSAGSTIGNPTGETRPRNVALLACIKF